MGILLMMGLVSGFADESTLIPQIYFHYVEDGSWVSDYVVNTTNFDGMMQSLTDLGYCTITFEEYYKFKNDEIQLCDRPIIIVFDDGLKDVYTNAYPIMQSKGQKGVMAIVPNRTDKPNSELMKWNNVIELQSLGWEVVSHSLSHAHMTLVSQEQQIAEYNNSKAKILERTGIEPKFFIFPYNELNSATMQECLEYYTDCGGYTKYISGKPKIYLMKNGSKGLYRIGTDGIQQKENPVEVFKSLLPYQTPLIIIENLTLSTPILDSSLNCSATVNKLSNITIDFYHNESLSVSYQFEADGSFSAVANNASGNWYCNVTANDGLTVKSEVSNVVFVNGSVEIVNVIPVAVVSDQTVTDVDNTGYEDVTLDGSSSYDSDGTIVSYEWYENNVLIGTGSILQLSFNVGSHNIQLKVTDDDNAASTADMILEVLPKPNTPLIADAGDDVSVEDSDGTGFESVVLDGSGSYDSDGSITSYIWYEDSVQIAVNVNASFEFAVGTHVITLVVTDNDGAVANDTVNVLVIPKPNVAPVAIAGDDVSVVDINNDGAESVLLNGSSSYDTDGSIVSYEWFKDSVLIGTGTDFYVDLSVGTYVITLVVTDNDGAVANDTVNVEVIDNPNIAPVADAGEDFDVTDFDGDGSELIVLNASGSYDSDGNIVNYFWYENDLPIGAGEILQMSLGIGNHIILLIVMDNDNAIGNDAVNIEILPKINNAPTANAGNDILDADYDGNGIVSVILNGSGSYDSDGSIVSYLWFEDSLQIAEGITPSVDLTVGEHLMTLIVTDNDNATVNDTVKIIILPYINKIPIADAGNDINVKDLNKDGKETVKLDGSKSTDPDGNITKYEWYENAILLGIGKTLNYNFILGQHNVTLKVFDNKNAIAFDSINVLVNDRPSIVLNGTAVRVNKKLSTTLRWTGALTSVKLYRDNRFVKNLNNNGYYVDSTSIPKTSYTYKICDQYICSNTITVK